MSKIDKKLLEKRNKATELSNSVDYIPATYDKRGDPRKTTRKLPNYKRKPAKKSAANTQELAQLTKDWYDFIAEKGFKDIEWYDPATGKGQNSSYLKGSSGNVALGDEIELKFYGSNDYVASEQLRYRCMSNFLAHTTVWKLRSIARKFTDTSCYQLKYCLELYSEGATYREIAHKLKTKKAKLWKPHSYYWVFIRLKPVLAMVEKWNREDPEGLLNPAQTEFYSKD